MILLLRLLLSFCFDWEDISNTRDGVSSDIQRPRISSKILRCASYFQLSSWCLDIPMKHCRSCLIYYVSNLKIVSICCLNGCIIHVMQCPALVHVGYWCIYPFSCKLSFIDVSIKTYLGYVGLLSQMYPCIWFAFERISLCSADKIFVHNITYWRNLLIILCII